jgi:ferrochelatase
MKKAIVLMNMGGPNNLGEVDVFLKNMFNDKYIIGAPQPIRAMIGWLIRRQRIKEATHNYSLLGGVSPIVGHTKRLIRRLEKEVDADVFQVMRYTPPFANEVVAKLKHYDEIYAIPMYPHYSSTTTKSSIEDFMRFAKMYGVAEKVKTLDDYYDDELYNKVIVERIKESLNGQDSKKFTLIFSGHGLPQKVIDKGDLYQKHILENVKRAKKELKKQGIKFKSIEIAYQSRLGPLQWLRPYLEDKLEEVVRDNKKVIIYPTSFTVDNSETQGELDIEYREVAEELGFKDYRVAKAPNHHPLFVECLKKMYEKMTDVNYTNVKEKTDGIIMLAQGSIKASINDEFIRLVHKIKKKDKKFKNIHAAFLDFSEPTIEEVVQKQIKNNITTIYLYPYFLALDKELSIDLANILKDLSIKHKNINFHLLEHFGKANKISDVIINEINEIKGNS